jgi:hypothetical protein
MFVKEHGMVWCSTTILRFGGFFKEEPSGEIAKQKSPRNLNTWIIEILFQMQNYNSYLVRCKTLDKFQHFFLFVTAVEESTVQNSQ